MFSASSASHTDRAIVWDDCAVSRLFDPSSGVLSCCEKQSRYGQHSVIPSGPRLVGQRASTSPACETPTAELLGLARLSLRGALVPSLAEGTVRAVALLALSVSAGVALTRLRQRSTSTLRDTGAKISARVSGCRCRSSA